MRKKLVKTKEDSLLFNSVGQDYALTAEEEILAKELVSNFKLALYYKNSFFYSLAQYVYWKPTKSPSIPTAATDGINIWFNYDWFKTLLPYERNAVWLHEILHCALRHCARKGERRHKLWNIAGDVQINDGFLKEFNWCKVPKNGISKPDYLRESTEETYLALQELQDGSSCKDKSDLEDLLDKLESDLLPSPTDEDGNPILPEELDARWKEALKQAAEKSRSAGHIPQGFKRILDDLDSCKIPWRDALFNFIVKFPHNFEGFDRRFIYKKLYIDNFDGEAVELFLCIDTSGSIGTEELTLFSSELQGILSSYNHVKVHLYWADCSLYGPYEIEEISDMPLPEGGGGTSFIPFFNAVKEADTASGLKLAIYFTDGYGSFPKEYPDFQTMWVTLPNTLNASNYPFGEVISLED